PNEHKYMFCIYVVFFAEVCFAFFFFQAEDGIRDTSVTGVQTCALPISIASPRRFSNQFAITSEPGMKVEAPTEIPNSPLIAMNSANEVARLSANHASAVTAAPATIIRFGSVRSASHPISGPAAPPVIHPIEKATDRRARVHPKCLRTGTKKTAPQLIPPQMKNIATKIAPTMIHPLRSVSAMRSRRLMLGAWMR